MLVVGEAGSGLEAVRLVRKERPDLVMLDVMMPGMDGFAVLEKLRWTITGSRVLMFSAYNTADFILRALRLGAAGYLSKNSPPDEYIRAIRMVMQGVVYYSGDPSLVEHILKLRPDGRHPSGLSAPEIECLVWTAEGMTLEAVAASMKLTINQVRAVKHSLCKKTGFSDPARLTRFAAALGFINIQN